MSDELSAAAKALLEGARRAPGPSAARRARVTAGVLGATSTGAGLAAAATAGGSGLKLFGAGLIAVLVGASGTVALLQPSKRVAAPKPEAVVGRLQARPPSPPPRLAPPVTLPPPAPVPPPAIQAAEQQPQARQAAAAPLPTSPPQARQVESQKPPPVGPLLDLPPPAPRPFLSERRGADSSAEEVLALSAALAALEQGRLEEALVLAQGATRAHPNGVLRPELTLAEVLALCALERREEARALARSLPPNDRTPLVLEKLRGSCAPPGSAAP